MPRKVYGLGNDRFIQIRSCPGVMPKTPMLEPNICAGNAEKRTV